MNASIADQLEAEWDHAVGWFQRHQQPHPYDEHQQHTHQEKHVTLAATSTTLNAHQHDLRTAIENTLAGLRDAAEQHLPRVEQDAAAIAAEAAAQDNTPIVKAALAATHVPAELLTPVAAMLDALAAAHPQAGTARPQPA